MLSNILGAIGRTPLVRLNRMAPRHANVFVKCEFFNPLSSVKDRLALAMVEEAERSGELRPGQTVVEATSGSTGVGLAMVCAVKRHPMVVVTRGGFCEDVRMLMKFLGAKVVVCPRDYTPQEMKAFAFELAERNDWFIPRQFENPANAACHQATTGQEILDAFTRDRLDYFVSGYGTGGTISGVGEALKAERPECQVVVVEPEQAQMLRGEEWRPHQIQGWSPNYLPKNLDQKIHDLHCAVSDEDAKRRARELAECEGIMSGFSGGATVHAALLVAERAKKGANIVAMVPDSAERYLSTALFDHCRKTDGDTVPNMVSFDDFRAEKLSEKWLQA